MAAAARGVTIIKGYVVVLPDRNDDDSDLEGSDDDNDWPDFGEMSAMASGGNYISYSRPKKMRVTIKSIRAPMPQYICEGHLHLTESWWLITAQTKNRGRVHYIGGYPTYELRTDNLVSTHKLPIQFLTTVGRTPENEVDPIVEALLTYLKDSGLEKRLTFQNLEEMIDGYIATLDEGEQPNYRKSLYSSVWLSAEGQLVWFAMKYPNLFKMASQVLPCHFIQMAQKSRFMEEDKLHELEKATSNCPWVFGFKQILYREYGVMGMEAQLRSWISSGLIQTLPPVQKDALYIYNALKVNARKRGHTYVSESDLRHKSAEFMEKHVVRNWKDALDFLDVNAVIVRETEVDCVKVFLKSNWYAERDTAKAFSAVLENGVKDPLEWDVDLDSSDFDKVRRDADQWTAVHLMSNSPITVLSGKGGCGKTSVVTTLLSHACVRSGKLEKKEDHEIDDVSDGEQTPSKSKGDHSKVNMSIGPITQSENEAITKDGNQDASETYLSQTNLGSKILLTAPTGKAAILLGRKARLKSCTLHSVIMSFKMHCVAQNRKKRENPKGGKDEETEWAHAEKEVLVVDECSLVSVSTFSTVTNILLKECSLKKIILLGDVRQLPSIEPGNFLGDVFNVLAPLGFSIELRTNHRAESELIVQNATRISHQTNPLFDSTKQFHLLQPQEQDQQGRDDIVRWLLQTAADIQDHTKSQFVAFTRRDCEAVNELCCRHYNKHSLKGPKDKWEFRPGDKVCMTKNGLVSHHTVKQNKPKGKREGERSEDESGMRSENLSGNRKHGRQTPVKRNLSSELGAAGAQKNTCMSNTEQKGRSKLVQSRKQCTGGADGLENSLDDIPNTQPYEDTLDDLINAAHGHCERTDMSSVDADDSLLSSQLNRTDVSSVLDDFFEPSSQKFSKSQNNKLRLKKKTTNGVIADSRIETKQSTSKDGGESLERPVVPVPEPEEPEQEIDGSTEDRDIARRDVKLCNGEIFFIERMFTRVSVDGKAQSYLTLNDRDEEKERRVCVEYRQLMKHCKMRHAWVRTIHTFQGSESQSVVYILGNIFYENWQHVYTAITRGRQSVYVVGSPVTLNKTIVRRVPPRLTTLDIKLLDHLKPREKLVQTCVQQIANSLKEDRESKGDNSQADEKTLFDSDDSWMCSLNETFGLDIDGSVLDPGGDSFFAHRGDNSQLTPTKSETPDSPLRGKRQGSHSDDSILQSPPKAKKLEPNVAVTPVRSSLNALSLMYEFSDDDLL